MSASPIEVSSLSAIEHLLSHRPERIQKLFFSQAPGQLKQRVMELHDKAKAAGVPVDFSSKGVRSSEPLKALVAPFEYAEFSELVESLSSEKRAVLVALDHLQDPQNFGALCRSAEGLGAQGILIPKDRSVQVTAGVYNASVGAVETLPIACVSNLSESLRKLKEAGFWIVGASLGEGATPPSKMPDFEKVVLVLGAELEGLSPSIDKLCDWRVLIPLLGRVQSLNVSAAGAILIYELARSKTAKQK